MKAREVHARQGYEGGKPCQEVERLEEHVRGAVAIGSLERVTNAPAGGEARPSRTRSPAVLHSVTNPLTRYWTRVTWSPTWTAAVPVRVAVAEASSTSVTLAVPTFSTIVRRTFFVCGSRI